LWRRVAEWSYLVGIALLALAIGAGALWFSARGMGHGGTMAGTGSMAGVVGMDEAGVDPVSAGLRVEWANAPADPTPGQPVTLRYRVIDATSGLAVTDLPLDHERPMHLIVVSRDLGTFQHIHPELVGDAYAVTTTLPTGAYTLYSEFQRDGRTVLDQRPLTVGAATATGPVGLAQDLTPKTVGDVTVALTAPQAIQAGQAATFTFALTANGQPVTDLIQYLGADAHVAVVSADSSRFAHTHGETVGAAGGHADNEAHAAGGTVGPDIAFTHTFATPGLYKVWGQFQRGGTVITVPFVVEVR
jgi:Cu+-exporting ATPase